MLTKDEIVEIIHAEVEVYESEDDLVDAAAEAIAARLTPVYLMSLFASLHKSATNHGIFYTVPDMNGHLYIVRVLPEPCVMPLWCAQEDGTECSTGDCDHVEAVELYCKREEAK